jgi:hypothetical protein
MSAYTCSELLVELDIWQPKSIFLYDSRVCLEIDIKVLEHLLYEHQLEQGKKSPARLSIPHRGIAILFVRGSIRSWLGGLALTQAVWSEVWRRPIMTERKNRRKRGNAHV